MCERKERPSLSEEAFSCDDSSRVMNGKCANANGNANGNGNGMDGQEAGAMGERQRKPNPRHKATPGYIEGGAAGKR